MAQIVNSSDKIRQLKVMFPHEQNRGKVLTQFRQHCLMHKSQGIQLKETALNQTLPQDKGIIMYTNGFINSYPA